MLLPSRVETTCIAAVLGVGLAASIGMAMVPDGSPGTPPARAPETAPETAPDKAPAKAPERTSGNSAGDSQKAASYKDCSEDVTKIRNARGMPGLVAGCVTRDGVELLGCAGVRRREEEAPLTVDDRMHLGSCTKAITATLAAVLVAEGKLKWDSTIGQVLGQEEGEMDSGWRDVTLEQLLRHRGGAPARARPQDWATAWNCTEAPHKCRQAFVRALLSQPPAQSPGTHVYSNQGYAIAGYLCETVAGKPYETLVAERLFAPLGIQDYGFGAPVTTVLSSPSGHRADGTPDNGDNPSAIAPAGRVHMPVREWMKFLAFHVGAKPPPELEGAAGELAHLHKNGGPDANEALGWYCVTRDWGGNVLTHNGSNTLWYCTAWISPERGFAVLAACNQGGDLAAKACDEACHAMIVEHVTARVKAISDQRLPAPQEER